MLALWLLSTTSSPLLVRFFGVRSSYDVWSTTNCLFAVVIGLKLLRIKHDLHSIKKGTLSIKEYIAKIQNTYALIEALGRQISESKKVEVVLTGLTPDFDVVLVYASFSSKTLFMRKLVDMLLEYESRHQRAVLYKI